MLIKCECAAVKLDWSRLLGFDQLPQGADASATTGLNDPRMAKLGGGKMGVTKPGGRRPDIVDVARVG